MITFDYFLYVTKPKSGLTGPWSLNNILQFYVLLYVCEHVYVCVVRVCMHGGHGLWYTYEGQRTTSVSPCLLSCGFRGQAQVLKLDGRRLCPVSHLTGPLVNVFVKFFLEKEDVHKFEDSLGYEWDPVSKKQWTNKCAEPLSTFPCPSPVLVHISSISSMCTQNKLVKYALWGWSQGRHALNIRTMLLVFDR